MNETDIEAGSPLPNATRSKTHPLGFQPLDRNGQIIYPQTHMVQGRDVHLWPRLGIDRLHQVHFHGKRWLSRHGNIFVDVLFFAAERPMHLKPEKVDPQLPQPILALATYSDLLHP